MNKALRKARRAAGLSMDALSMLASLASRSTIYDIESGRVRTPAYDTAMRILRVLKEQGVDHALLDRIFPVSPAAPIKKKKSRLSMPRSVRRRGAANPVTSCDLSGGVRR